MLLFLFLSRRMKRYDWERLKRRCLAFITARRRMRMMCTIAWNGQLWNDGKRL